MNDMMIDEPNEMYNQSYVQQVKEYFDNKFINLSSEWLVSVLKDCPLSDPQSLIQKVFESFCTSNITEVIDTDLKPDYTVYKMTDLEGILEKPRVVEVKSVINVGVPQDNQIDDTLQQTADDSDEEKWENKYLDSSIIDDTETGKTAKRLSESNRILKFELTDGFNDIIGVEIEKLACIDINVSKGTKFLLLPPMEIKRSYHFLNNLNVQLIYWNDSSYKSNDFDPTLAADLFKTKAFKDFDSNKWFNHKLQYLSDKRKEERAKAKEKKIEAKKTLPIPKMPNVEIDLSNFESTVKVTSKPKKQRASKKSSNDTNSPIDDEQIEETSQIWMDIGSGSKDEHSTKITPEKKKRTQKAPKADKSIKPKQVKTASK